MAKPFGNPWVSGQVKDNGVSNFNAVCKAHSYQNTSVLALTEIGNDFDFIAPSIYSSTRTFGSDQASQTPNIFSLVNLAVEWQRCILPARPGSNCEKVSPSSPPYLSTVCCQLKQAKSAE